jgi:oligopeptide/dipeptide ABC transporter ATP-binding protein
MLELEDIAVDFATAQGVRPAVAGVSLRVAAGECLGVAGESGAGKSQALLGPFGAGGEGARVRGAARLDGTDVLALDRTALDRLRGASVGIVFQDPLASLTPHLTIGSQIAEVLRRHRRVEGEPAQRRALELLRAVDVPDPDRRLAQYPHELSGGLRQRALIAIAIACDPGLLIADEPTTALDVTVQAQVLAVFRDLQRERRMALVLVSHDFGVLASGADRIVVMYAGRIVEEGSTAELVRSPRHPYTAALLACVPRIDARQPMAPIEGPSPAAGAWPAGCAFHPRCPRAIDRCRIEQPQLRSDGTRGATGDGADPALRRVACHRPIEP